MAVYNVYRIRIGSVGDVDFPTGSIVYVKWNDSTEVFTVDVHDSGDVYVSTETSGPDLTVDDYTDVDYNFQYCSSSTLVSFSKNYTLFPYALRVDTANASQCVLNHICDILITSVTTTNSTTETANDGEAEITVDGADGPFTYSLSSDFSSSQSSNIFTGLAPGDYYAYVKDTYNCIAQARAFTVGFDSSYGARWRMEFDASLAELEGYSYKVDILQRDYAGAVTEIKGADKPFVITWQGENEDKFKQIIASKANINITVETAGEYEDLFTGDEREFLIKFYIDEGAGFVLEWTGYVLQETYEENWQAEPYYISFIATDGLADLDKETYNEDSVIKGDANLISIIANCIRTTDLGLNICSAINRFETNYTTTTSSDPLFQTYFNTYFLNGRTKKQVLEDVLKTFGARILQSSNKWWIISIEDTVSSSLPYRTYDSAGLYVSNSTLSPQVEIDYPDTVTRLCWTGAPLLRIKNGYKTIKITHDLGLVNNIFYTGRFHEDDFVEETGLFEDIGIDLLEAIGADYGMEEIRNGPSDQAFYIDFQNAATTSLNFPFIYTLSKTVTNDATLDSYKFSFQYYISSQSLFTRFDWKIKVGSTYLQPSGTFSSDTDFQYVPIYVDSSNYNKWNKFEIEFRSSGTDVQAFVRLYSNNSYDYSSLSALASANVSPSTTGFRVGDRRIALDTVGGVNLLRHYTLNYDVVSTSSPDIIQPADYNATTNPRVWKLDDTVDYSGSQNNRVYFYLLDELKLEYFLNDEEPAETKLYQTTINQKNKVIFETDVFFGDLPGTYNDEHIYKNYLSLSDGTPTELWGRSTLDEELPILDILSLDIAGQYSSGARTLNGSLVGDLTLRAENCLVDINDGNRKFMILGMEADYANNNYTVELPEVLSGVTGPPSDTSGFTTGFSLGFRA